MRGAAEGSTAGASRAAAGAKGAGATSGPGAAGPGTTDDSDSGPTDAGVAVADGADPFSLDREVSCSPASRVGPSSFTDEASQPAASPSSLRAASFTATSSEAATWGRFSFSTCLQAATVPGKSVSFGQKSWQQRQT